MKLTKSIKENLVHAMVSAKFTTKIEAARNVLKAKATELISAASIPEELITAACRPYMTFATSVRIDRRSVADVMISLNEAKPVLSLESDQYSPRFTLDESLFEEELEAYDRVYKNRADYKGDLESLLAATTTDKALLALLPEVKPFLPVSWEASAGALVPVALIERIQNTMKED